MDEGNYRGRDEHVATTTLARDPFSTALRELHKNPAAIKGQTRIDVADDYGNLTTWNLDLFRDHKGVTVLVQVVGLDGVPSRFVIPPKVTDAMARHQSSLTSKARARTGRLGAEKRRAQGLPVGNPAALAAARKAKARRHK
jgi:hypothetical protein